MTYGKTTQKCVNVFDGRSLDCTKDHQLLMSSKHSYNLMRFHSVQKSTNHAHGVISRLKQSDVVVKGRNHSRRVRAGEIAATP